MKLLTPETEFYPEIFSTVDPMERKKIVEELGTQFLNIASQPSYAFTQEKYNYFLNSLVLL